VATSGGAEEKLNMGAQLQIIPYKKPPQLFFKLHGLIDFQCAQILPVIMHNSGPLEMGGDERLLLSSVGCDRA